LIVCGEESLALSAMRRSARQLKKASASNDDVFTALPDDLSARVIAQMPPDSLARLALSSKALSTRVAERVTDKALWDTLVPLIQEASQLCTVVRNQDDEQYKGKQMDTFMALLAHLKDVCPASDQVVLEMELHLRITTMDTTRWRSSRLFFRQHWGQSQLAQCYIGTKVQGLLDRQLKQCVVACSLSMKPDQLMVFAADVTKASPTWWEAPSAEERCSTWCEMMSVAIRANVHRLEWSPQLAISLAKRAPHYEGSQELTTLLVSAVPLSPQVIKACVHSSDLSPKEASAVMLAFINKSFARLHEDEFEGEDMDEEDYIEFYYEDDYDRTEYITDRAQVFLNVTRQFNPPIKLTLWLVRALVKEDEFRHCRIEDNHYQDPYEHSSPSYDSFLGTRAFIAGWVSILDFTSLSHQQSEALVSGLASFKDSDVKAYFVPFALEWIKALVQPLKKPGRRSNQKDVELAKSVEKVCQAILMGS